MEPNKTEDINDGERERFEERAAIMEYDGGLTRAEAEASAWKELIQRRKTTNDKRHLTNE